MKRKVAFVLCVAMLVCMVSNALAAVKFSKFTMTFSDTTSYQSITSDTQVYLMGRPDSSVPSCTVTGKFGAG